MAPKVLVHLYQQNRLDLLDLELKQYLNTLKPVNANVMIDKNVKLMVNALTVHAIQELKQTTPFVVLILAQMLRHSSMVRMEHANNAKQVQYQKNQLERDVLPVETKEPAVVVSNIKTLRMVVVKHAVQGR